MAHEAVLDIEHLVPDGDPVFRWPDDTEDPGPLLRLPREMWEDMGAPTVVTIRVLPGDALNEED